MVTGVLADLKTTHLKIQIKMKRFKIGDRVKDSGFLGEGEVTKIIKSDLDSKVIVGYMVMFDKTPDIRYNMGENPCFMLNGQLYNC